MNSQELLETYPNAAEVVRKHFMEKLLESLVTSDLPDDFKEFARQQEIDNDKIASLIDAQPRGLFEVFDQHQLYIGIIPTYTMDGVIFRYTLTTLISGEQPTRLEAEKTVIELAFKMLNEKL